MARTNGLTNQLWCDRHTRVLVRRPYAVPLTIIEFAIFYALREKKETLTTNELIDRVYHGAIPCVDPVGTLHMCKRKLNDKIARFGMQVVTPVRKGKALWRRIVNA